MVDVEKTIIPVLVIPLLLLIMVAVYMNAADNTKFVFEQTVTNETTGETADGANSFSSKYDCKEDSLTAVTNGTMTCGTNCYNVTYVNQGRAPCTFQTNATTGAILISYTAYKGDSYTAFEKVDNMALQGFKMSSLLPYVVIAMTILVVIVGTFVAV